MEKIKNFNTTYAEQMPDDEVMEFAHNWGSIQTKEKLTLLDIAYELKRANSTLKERWKKALPELYIPEN